MHLSFTTVDVFTTTPYKGNPLAIVHVPAGTCITEEQKQKIAREFNLSETVFLHLPASNVDTKKQDNIDSTTWHISQHTSDAGSQTFSTTTTSPSSAAAEHAIAQPPSTSLDTLDFDIFTPAAHIAFAGHPTIGTALHIATHASLKELSHIRKLRTIAGTIPFSYDAARCTATVCIPHDIHVHSARLPHPFDNARSIPRASSAASSSSTGTGSAVPGSRPADSQATPKTASSSAQEASEEPKTTAWHENSNKADAADAEAHARTRGTGAVAGAAGFKNTTADTVGGRAPKTKADTTSADTQRGTSVTGTGTGTGVPIVSIVRGMAFGLARLPDLDSLGKVSGPLIAPLERFKTDYLDKGSGWDVGLTGSFYYVDLGMVVEDAGTLVEESGDSGQGGTAYNARSSDEQVGQAIQQDDQVDRPVQQGSANPSGTGASEARDEQTRRSEMSNKSSSSKATRRFRTRCIPQYEDPGTGSASAALCSYISLTDGMSAATQVNASGEVVKSFHLTQGVEMGRPCDIYIDVRMSSDAKKVLEVLLTGSAVGAMEGVVSVPPGE